MSSSKKRKPLSAVQLNALPITIGEASKLLGPVTNNLSDEYVAQKILLVSELARILAKTLYLQK